MVTWIWECPNAVSRCYGPSVQRPLHLCVSLCVVEARAGAESGEANESPDVAWSESHGSPVWPSGSAHLVGILVGHHGARHVFCRLRLGCRHVWILHTY